MFSASFFISPEISPFNNLWAFARVWAFWADSRSPTASAWVRSIFPFKKALCVNSPLFAGRTSLILQISSISLRIMNGFPCGNSSKTSSPVYELGAGKYIAIEWFTRLASLGFILKFGRRVLHISLTAGPLMRTAAIALFPGGVARAMIVSIGLCLRM